MKGRDFRVPGLLFIDTPGHQAFSTLRARGGALADIAILVVDINEGFMPQTKEALNILRRNKTPFVVAATKVDRIHGWESAENAPFVLSVKGQADSTTEKLDDRLYALIGQLTDAGVPSAERIDRITDFTKSVAIVPVSSKTGEGMPDLLLTLVGLAQRFLEASLSTDIEKPGRGTVLEVKDERGIGLTLDVILYDGNLKLGDTVVVGRVGAPKVTKVKGLLRPKPRDEMRDHREPFNSVKEVHAAAGLKLVAQDVEGVLAGAPLVVVRGAGLAEAKEEVERDSRVGIETAAEGVFVKADTLGSLEALAFELKEKGIPLKRVEVGDISRRDLTDALTIEDPLLRTILAFNVKLLPDAREAASQKEYEAVGVLSSNIIYDLLEQYEKWRADRTKKLDADRRDAMTFPAKILLLPDHTFRVSKPAIVGVRVLAGRLRPDRHLLRPDGRVVGLLKSIREGEETKKEARAGEEVAAAIDDVTVGRQISEGDTLYLDLPAGDARTFFRNPALLNEDEQEVLREIAVIKRKEERFWAM
jgi:translation initiation factor 5B